MEDAIKSTRDVSNSVNFDSIAFLDILVATQTAHIQIVDDNKDTTSVISQIIAWKMSMCP